MKRRRRRRRILSFTILAATIATMELAACHASAQGPPSSANEAAPAYTLSVDSDSPDLSFDAIASRLSIELGAKVVAASTKVAATRAAIAIRYRDGTLTVRATHAGDRVLERSIAAKGDAASVNSEAILLSGNLARDEAKELLDELEAARKKPEPIAAPSPPPPPPVTEPAPPIDTVVDEDDREHRTFTFALVHPIATNGKKPNIRSTIDLSLAFGRVGRVEAFQMSFGAGYASRSASGMQFAGGATVSDGTMTGVQLAMGGTLTRGFVTGAQLAGGATYAAGGMDGAQIATGANVTRGSSRGAQISSGANVSTKDFVGMQGTAGLNIADRIGGAQLALLNIGGDVSGAQLGVLNIARKVKGVQLGAINIAEEVDGAAIGFASISKDSIHPVAWSSNLVFSNVGIKFATKYVYTVTALGVGTRETELDGSAVFTAAIGFHLPISIFGPGPLEDLDLETEAAYTQVDIGTDTNHGFHPRVLAGYKFTKRFRVFLGGGPRVPLDFGRGSPMTRPEFIAGVQF